MLFVQIREFFMTHCIWLRLLQVSLIFLQVLLLELLHLTVKHRVSNLILRVDWGRLVLYRLYLLLLSISLLFKRHWLFLLHILLRNLLALPSFCLLFQEFRKELVLIQLYFLCMWCLLALGGLLNLGILCLRLLDHRLMMPQTTWSIETPSQKLLLNLTRLVRRDATCRGT